MINFAKFNSLVDIALYFDTPKKCREAIAQSRWADSDVPHFVSKEYLQRYVDEAIYRYNTREASETYRFYDMFAKSIGNVTYKDVKMKKVA